MNVGCYCVLYMYCLRCCLLGLSVCFKTDYDAKPLLEVGTYGRSLGEFNEPSGITKDGDDVILVADSRNDRIQVSCR